MTLCMCEGTYVCSQCRWEGPIGSDLPEPEPKSSVPPDVDYHNWLIEQCRTPSNPSGGGVAGNFEEWVALSGQGDPLTPEQAFDIFIRRWVHPQWWAHLMDNDDNEAEYVRRWIRGEVVNPLAEALKSDG